MALAFDLRQLRYFATVAECGSFRAAAERLHLSQPPLSRQMQALERALGATLLERRRDGVALTPAGREALVRAQALLGEAEALARLFADPARAPGRLRIGITAAVTVADRTRLARAWQRALPGTALALEAGFSRDLIPALKEGRLAFALVGLPGDVTGLETRPVQSSPLGAALPASHRLARRRVVSLLEVTDLPLFWIPRTHNPAYHDFCLRYFRRIGYRPETIVVEPGQLQTLERIAQGEGWTIPNGATLETKVRGVAYRALAEGEDLAVRVIAAWRAEGADARCARLAAVAARVLGSGAPTRRRAGRTA
ncbi:MAG: LysR family transcriptional regulator [Burkholderiales bacterium]|nr:LysR family transcriptional regulator [Burkholderiales bacterium]